MNPPMAATRIRGTSTPKTVFHDDSAPPRSAINFNSCQAALLVSTPIYLSTRLMKLPALQPPFEALVSTPIYFGRKLSAVLEMSDSKPKCEQVRSGHAVGDLRLSVIQRGFPHYTHRQIQRWAESGKIPGAYRLKRGHWRVRNCRAFRRWWWSHDAKCRLSWAIEGDVEQKRQRWWRQMVQSLPRDWVARLKQLKEEMPFNDRLGKVIAMSTRTGAQGDLDRCPHPYWWDTPINKLPRELLQTAWEVGDDWLEVASAIGDLIARHVEPSVKNIATFLNISRATFYRRGYNKHRKTCLHALAQVAPVLENDSRAKRLYKDQVLQETKSEP
jgi:hypothetical protein